MDPSAEDSDKLVRALEVLAAATLMVRGLDATEAVAALDRIDRLLDARDAKLRTAAATTPRR